MEDASSPHAQNSSSAAALAGFSTATLSSSEPACWFDLPSLDVPALLECPSIRSSFSSVDVKIEATSPSPERLCTYLESVLGCYLTMPREDAFHRAKAADGWWPDNVSFTELMLQPLPTSPFLSQHLIDGLDDEDMQSISDLLFPPPAPETKKSATAGSFGFPSVSASVGRDTSSGAPFDQFKITPIIMASVPQALGVSGSAYGDKNATASTPVSKIKKKSLLPSSETPVKKTTAKRCSTPRRMCSVEDCSRYSQSNGLCIRHGGGRRCKIEGCTRGAQSTGRCKAHGGGVRCKVDGCTRSSQGMGRCRTHGGGKLCSFPGCEKGTQCGGLCSTHGGTRICSVPGCEKVDRGGGRCGYHRKMEASVGPQRAAAPRHFT